MENKNQNFTILYIIKIFLNYWPMLAISTAFFVLLGLLYFRYASKTYSVFARISIQTEDVSTGRGASQYINVSDLMSQERSFTNEITFLRSTPLLKEVVNEMNLFTSYYLKEDKIPQQIPFAYYNIYNNSPFIVVVDKNSLQPLNTMFYLKIIDDETFMIHAAESSARTYNFSDESISRYPFYFYISGTYSFGEEIKNDYCSFKILLNSQYSSEMYQGKDLYFRFNSPTVLSYRIQEALSINTAFYESRIADITFEWENVDLAIEFLNNLIDKYIEKNLEKKNYNAINTIDYIDQQLSTISGSLGASEQQLQNFRTSRDVMNIDEKSTNIYNQKRSLEVTRDEVETRYQYLSRLHEYFDLHKDSATFIAPSFMGMSDATMATLIQELTALSRERSNLIGTNQLRNPRIKTLDANIAAVKKVISDNLSFSLAATQNELTEIEKRIGELDKEITRLPQTQRQLIGLEREFNINDAVYTSLLDKRIQAEIIRASNLPDSEIIEPVRYVEVSSPSIKKVGIISLFLGLFFPGVFIIYVNFLTQKVRIIEELALFTNLPVIGHIPSKGKARNNVIVSAPQSPIAEKFHSIKSDLIYYLLGEKNKIILITSTLQDEGKSFTSLNLAHSFATTHKTILVSFDLRKKNEMMKELNNHENAGLSAFLNNQANLKDIIIKTDFPNLDYLPSGAIPPDPVALLATNRTKELFAELKSKYDYVIIDTPPFELVTDAFLLMQYADIKLYISRLGKVTKKAFKQAMKSLEQKNINNVYIIYNDITKIDKSYNYTYSYKEPKRRRMISFLWPRKKNK